MQVETYDESDDFFEMFEQDLFDDEEEIFQGNSIVEWKGLIDGNVVAGFNFTTNEGWYDDTVI